MGDDEKTRGGRKQATPPEGETVAGAQAAESPPPASGQAGAAPPPTTPPGPSSATPPPPPPPSLETVQAQTEYVQIAGELAVASPSVGALGRLQDRCAERFWCLPDVNCSARDFTSDAVREAFVANRPCLEQSA
jgi:hypothetical protein